MMLEGTLPTISSQHTCTYISTSLATTNGLIAGRVQKFTALTWIHVSSSWKAPGAAVCMPSSWASRCQFLSSPTLGRISNWAGLQGPHGSCPRQTQHFSLPLGVSTLAGIEASSAPALALALPDRSKLQGHRVRCGRAACAEPGGKELRTQSPSLRAKPRPLTALLCHHLSQEPPTMGTLLIATASAGGSGYNRSLSLASPHGNQTNIIRVSKTSSPSISPL